MHPVDGLCDIVVNPFMSILYAALIHRDVRQSHPDFSVVKPDWLVRHIALRPHATPAFLVPFAPAFQPVFHLATVAHRVAGVVA